MATRRRPALAAMLVALALLYGIWFSRQTDWIAVALFALPPLASAFACWRGGPRAAFWAGVLALLWFSHGVMVAWTRPPERLFAWIEILLALAIVVVASLPGLRMRFGRKKAPE